VAAAAAAAAAAATYGFSRLFVYRHVCSYSLQLLTFNEFAGRNELFASKYVLSL
jgi:hypothetical protein